MSEGNPASCLVAVNDTGRGIPEKKLHSICDFGTQSDPADAAQGTGIGLCYVGKVTTALYGALPKIQSKEGKGTTISFVANLTPVVRADDIGVVPPVPAPAPAPFNFNETKPRRCLIIDDMKMNRKMLRNVLGKVLLPQSTWTFMEAESGEEAIEMVTEGEQPIDLATVDYHMKDMSGSETVVQLKALCASTVCIGITGNSEGSEAQGFRDAGCLDVWGKPPPNRQEMAAQLFVAT